MMRGAIVTAVLLLAAGAAPTQPRPPATGAAQAAAPIDITGWWVAVVSEDWRHRMATPRKGDYESMPLNAEGRRAADAWDLAADDAAGLQCKAFGVGGVMRQPTRLHITWQDENTLKVELDAGTQTRVLRFGTAAAEGEPTWQGHSLAQWLRPPGGGAGTVRAQIGNSTGPIAPGGGGRGQRGGPALSATLREGGSLMVSTTNFRAGYLRKNGVPYSENAKITEHIHLLPRVTGVTDDWLHVVTIVEDPRYLNDLFYVSTHFKREANGSKWNPTPCRTAPPPGGRQSEAVPLPPL